MRGEKKLRKKKQSLGNEWASERAVLIKATAISFTLLEFNTAREGHSNKDKAAHEGREINLYFPNCISKYTEPQFQLQTVPN